MRRVGLTVMLLLAVSRIITGCRFLVSSNGLTGVTRRLTQLAAQEPAFQGCEDLRGRQRPPDHHAPGWRLTHLRQTVLT
jgi:hypothetical protein